MLGDISEDRQYDEVQPELAWMDGATSHTLVVNVGAFTREQLRVRRDATANGLNISGERWLVGNRWSRFNVDVPLPENSNAQAIKARYENGTLYVTVPKLQVSIPQQPQPIPPLPSAAELPDKRKAEAPKEEVKSLDGVQAGSEKATAASTTKDEPKPQSPAKPREEERRAKEAKTGRATAAPPKKEESPPVAQPTLPKIPPKQEESRPVAQPEITGMTNESRSEHVHATAKKAPEKKTSPTSDEGLLKDGGKEERPRPPTENGAGQGGQEKKEAATLSKDGERQVVVNVVVSALLVMVFGIYFINKIWYGLGGD